MFSYLKKEWQLIFSRVTKLNTRNKKFLEISRITNLHIKFRIVFLIKIEPIRCFQRTIIKSLANQLRIVWKVTAIDLARKRVKA